MTFIRKLLSALCLVTCFSSLSSAETTDNLINNNNWSGVVYGYDPNDCCSNPGGSQPLYELNQGIIKWSYGQATVSQSIGIQNALSFAGTGIQVQGYTWSWWVRNDNGGTHQSGVDRLNYWVNTTNSSGQLIDQMSGTYDTRFEPTVFSGTRTYSSPYNLSDLGGLTVSFSGRDFGFWGGLYGPEVGNVDIRILYSVDQCSVNPLYSSSCPGYEQAYFDFQCSQNPLYSNSCPGYLQAWILQTCSASPLADLLCPGYAEAYFEQQCDSNPLYNSQCSGYGAAMASKLEKEKEKEPVTQTNTTNQVAIEEDNTKLDQTSVDVGGVSMSSDGSISAPDNLPEVAKEKKTTVPTSLILSIIRRELEEIKSKETSVLMESITSSIENSSNSNEEILGTGITVNTSRNLNQEENVEVGFTFSTQQSRESSSVVLESTNSIILSGDEQEEKSKSSVRNGGSVSEMAGGPDIAVLAQTPVDFNNYLRQTIQDSPFYKSEEIYKNQQNVDNRRALRMFGGSDRLHQEMINQQYR